MDEEMAMQKALGQAADEGRGTDTTLAHLTLGEVVIPREMMEDPEVSQIVQAIFQAFGADLREFTVGDPANKINPEPGYPEFFLGKLFKGIKKVFKKIAPIALPILGTMIPGVGPVVGGALGGALGGAVSGKGIKGILTGGALGGLGGYLSGGSLLGSKAGASLAETSGNALMQGPTQGSGIMGALTRGVGNNVSMAQNAVGGLGSGTAGGSGGLSSLIRPAASIFSGINESDDQDKMAKQLLAAQGRAESAIAPYSQIGLDAQKQLAGNLTEGFDTSNLYDDPGYQYRLSEGQKALERSLAAQGMGESGAAMRAASELGQGYAADQYDTAYNQWLQRNQQLAGLGSSGQSAALNLADIYGNQGNIGANKTLEKGNIMTRTIANVIGQRIIGYDRNGKPIYG